jgi:hypothetical protein
MLAPLEPVLSLSKEAAYSPPNNIPLLRSFLLLRISQPPVETGGYKDDAPTELNAPKSRNSGNER